MTRWIAASAGALAVALTLGLALPLGNEAAADGMKAPVYSAPTKKRCIAPVDRWWMRTSTPVTWVCAAAERCCYDRVLRTGHCLPASQRCF
jgi:hypothetical protein